MHILICINCWIQPSTLHRYTYSRAHQTLLPDKTLDSLAVSMSIYVAYHTDCRPIIDTHTHVLIKRCCHTKTLDTLDLSTKTSTLLPLLPTPDSLAHITCVSHILHALHVSCTYYIHAPAHTTFSMWYYSSI